MRLCRFAVALVSVGFGVQLAHAQVVLGWPIACEIGKTCEIQHYVDHGGGAKAKDYRCGTVTYKGHNGTDIRVLTMADERRGVNVLAAAEGTVLRARDEMADLSIAATGRSAIKGRNCGNGLVISHADGFETQYCHMARGSLTVKPGDIVTRGQSIGRVGLSGDTEFPHLHITVRQNNKVIDPFAYGAPEGACGGGHSLWTPAVQSSLGYKAGAVLNAGIAPRLVTIDDIDDGLGEESLTPVSPTILAYVRAIALQKGDVQRILLTGPGGPLVEHTLPPLLSDKDQTYMFVGRKRKVERWPAGRYAMVYTVVRDHKVVVERSFAAKLR